MAVSKFRRGLKRARRIKSFLRLLPTITDPDVPTPDRRIKQQARRIKQQARRIKQQARRIKQQTRQIESQAWQLERYDRQFERIGELLSNEDVLRARWEVGKASELRYRRRWLRTKGCPSPHDCYPEAFKKRFDPESPLDDRTIKHLNAPPGATVSILDVGAGAATSLGKRWEGRTVKITAVDPLAEDYNRLLDEFGIAPPVRTQPCEAERLTDCFPRDYFDLVNIKNALDHSYDPLTGIREMLEVVRPGGYVLLDHYVNEGESGGYEGLHQWNFCVDGSHFVIWNPGRRFSVNDAVADAAEITLETMRVDLNPPNAEVDKRYVREKLFVSLRKRQTSAKASPPSTMI